MANISRAERERRAADTPDPKPVTDVETKPVKADPSLIEMTKGSDSLSVHPSCVKAHQSAGWAIKEA